VVRLEPVDSTVPLTGAAARAENRLSSRPRNLDFDE
jgi:hypothetical protein